jgi:ABC-type bacteriocin/lantibiotic exporter with double-glycine peptidase domain
MRRIVQVDATGCGLACIAILAKTNYKKVRELALELLGFEDDGVFYTGTSDLVKIGKELNLIISSRRRKFKTFDNLPNKAILAINYKSKTDAWHWVVFHRTESEEYVLDPKKSIKRNKRKDLNRIAKKTTHWLGVDCV